MKVAKSHILIASLVLLAGTGFYLSGKRSTQSLDPVTALPELKVMEFKGKSPDGKAPAINLLDHVGAEPKQVQPATQTPPSQVVSSYTPKNKSVARSLALSEAAKGNWYVGAYRKLSHL